MARSLSVALRSIVFSFLLVLETPPNSRKFITSYSKAADVFGGGVAVVVVTNFERLVFNIFQLFDPN